VKQVIKEINKRLLTAEERAALFQRKFEETNLPSFTKLHLQWDGVAKGYRGALELVQDLAKQESHSPDAKRLGDDRMVE
jgi:hypothetical protein